MSMDALKWPSMVLCNDIFITEVYAGHYLIFQMMEMEMAVIHKLMAL
jgi:hypothetical protein